MSKREQILQAISDRMVADGFFGPTVEVEPTTEGDWRDAGGGLGDQVAVLDGAVQTLEEAVGEGERFALQLDAAVIYAVQGRDAASRRTRRADGLARLVAVLTADRTLGGLCSWLEVQPPQNSDEAVEGAAPVSTAAVTIEILFTAAEQAG